MQKKRFKHYFLSLKTIFIYTSNIERHSQGMKTSPRPVAKLEDGRAEDRVEGGRAEAESRKGRHLLSFAIQRTSVRVEGGG